MLQREDLALQGPQVAPQGFGFLTVVIEESLEVFIAIATQRNVIGRQHLRLGVRQRRLQPENWDGEEKSPVIQTGIEIFSSIYHILK